jgi:hypothetical protein
MRGPGFATLVAIGLAWSPSVVYGQFTDPRSYANFPVGLNQLELAYGVAHADASLDTSIVISGADLKLDAGALAYTRSFPIAHHLA